MNTTDWPGLTPDVVKKLLGNPTPAARRGSKAPWPEGSLRINLETGLWKDSETKEGGNFLELVQRELQTDRTGALDLANQRGLPISPLEKAARGMPQNQRTGPAPTSAIQRPTGVRQRDA